MSRGISLTTVNHDRKEGSLEEWRLLYQADALHRKEINRALARRSVTVAQIHALAVLDAANRPLPLTHLAEALLQESPSTTRLVDRMAARGLVRRHGDSTDRRRSLVEATDKGRELLEHARELVIETSTTAFGVLTERQRAVFKRLLFRFADAARERVRFT